MLVIFAAFLGVAQEQRSPNFKVEHIAKINTKGIEFSPVLVENRLFFVSEKETDLLNFNEINYSWQPYTTIMCSKVSDEDGVKKYSTPKLYKPNFFSNSAGVGPITFLDQSMVYAKVNLSYRDSAGVAHPMIYVDGNLLSFNSREYSCSHPTIDVENMVMYFTSDMPGGYGGTDLYKSEFRGDEWGKPINLGDSINTAADECFPFVDKAGTLYFSSNRKGTIGGLDLYYAFPCETYWEVFHFDETLNTTFNDFSLSISDDCKSGYFSSNRGHSVGKDDIFFFTFYWE